MRVVSVLCCARNSIYKTLPGVECYDADRDVRTFQGGTPIVAHPPCRRWSAFCAHQSKASDEEKALAPLCVEFLRANGGVLEHPAHSRLWQVLNLPKPGTSQGNLHCIEVQQAWWGYPMMKKTWLLFCGVDPSSLVIPFVAHNPRSGVGDRRRQQVMSKNQRAATHPALALWLVDAARQTTIRPQSK